jgi:hypothetical protein
VVETLTDGLARSCINRRRPMTLLHRFALLLTAALAGCASTGTDGAARPRQNLSVLTQEEMRAAHHTNVYEAVAALRANWIRPRGPISFADPTAGQVFVFQDGLRLGNVTYLRQVPVSDVRSLQFLSPTEATARFGLQSSAGPAIVINRTLGP